MIVNVYDLEETTHLEWGSQRQWFWWSTHGRMKPLRDFAWTLRNDEEGIIAYFDLRIDKGLFAAMNNNAKVISNRARGYRSEKTFSLPLIHSLGKLQLPKCRHKFS